MTRSQIPVIQRVIAILWPAFITAGIATILFSTIIDPDLLTVEYDISRLGVYSVCFFLFWLLGAVTATAACYYSRPCDASDTVELESGE